MSTPPPPSPPLSSALVSGDRKLDAPAFDEHVLRAASGLAALGVRQGDCVALLLRNDFAFLEASLAAVRLGAYAVPINWHFKGEEIAYVLADCEARVLVAHADLLAPVAEAVPATVTTIAVATPPEIASAYGSAPGGVPPGATSWDTWLTGFEPWRLQQATSPMLPTILPR